MIPQILQHHPNDDELKKRRKFTSSVCTLSSETDSVMTQINYNGSSMKINCNPLKLIQFLVIDLKAKLKDFVPDGKGFREYCAIIQLFISTYEL